MDKKMLIVGGGIAGLATALACNRAGWDADLLEQADAFSEVGAGIQLGPNVVKVLDSLGVGKALRLVAAHPRQLEVRNAVSGELLGVLPFGERMQSLYGAPYLSIARADIHQLLLDAVRAQGATGLHLSSKVVNVEQAADSVTLETVRDEKFVAPLVVGADGLWSNLRAHVVHDAAPRMTGHLAFRAMLPQADLPQDLRSQVVTAWMGPDFHAVQYPVRGGEWLNVVCIVHGQVAGDASNWDHSANASEIRRRLAGSSAGLRNLVEAIDHWRLWALCDRPPMQSAAEHAKGRIALLGDAAHPMRPYLAQGAGMAIEDAAALAKAISASGVGNGAGIERALQEFARTRWQRNARVQARSIRNGEIFHLQGALRWGRDLSLKLLGRRLLDVPWLYGGP